MEINKMVRPNILALKPYSNARDEYQGKAGIFLDANESPFGNFNRYPDPKQQALKAKISELKGISSSQIFVGNGSDEAIDLAYRIFCNPQQDCALGFSPSYGMYAISAGINDVKYLECPLLDDIKPDWNHVFSLIDQNKPKLIFICNPNNPTGSVWEKEEILQILNKKKSIVIVDEAYIDFCPQYSMVPYVPEYPNLIVLQTLSKAWSLASARIGIAMASPEIICLFNKVKPPYNVSGPSQMIGLEALTNEDQIKKQINVLNEERMRLTAALQQFEIVEKVYPSLTNFLLVQFKDTNRVFSSLVEKGIVVRDRARQANNCLRITIGKPEENNLLIKYFGQIQAA